MRDVQFDRELDSLIDGLEKSLEESSVKCQGVPEHENHGRITKPHVPCDREATIEVTYRCCDKKRLMCDDCYVLMRERAATVIAQKGSLGHMKCGARHTGTQYMYKARRL